MSSNTALVYRGYALGVSAHQHDDGQWAGGYAFAEVGVEIPTNMAQVSGLHATAELALEYAKERGMVAIDQTISES